MIITIVCKHCGDKKPLVKHKLEGITTKAFDNFQSDGWKYINGAHGICPECDIFAVKHINKYDSGKTKPIT